MMRCGSGSNVLLRSGVASNVDAVVFVWWGSNSMSMLCLQVGNGMFVVCLHNSEHACWFVCAVLKSLSIIFMCFAFVFVYETVTAYLLFCLHDSKHACCTSLLMLFVWCWCSCWTPSCGHTNAHKRLRGIPSPFGNSQSLWDLYWGCVGLQYIQAN